MGWELQQGRGILKQHSSCPGCIEDSASSCGELCREGGFPQLASSCLGWFYYDQLADTKAPAHSFLSTALLVSQRIE